MKKYFRFDDEPITGGQYLTRLIVGTLGYFIFVIPGFWVHAATAYKRAGAFKWSMAMRRISAVVIPLNVFFGFTPDQSIEALPFSTLIVLSLITTPILILHLYLLFANGNKPDVQNG